MLPELETTLYHGTIHEITKVDVDKGRPLKDFGRGFYMAVSKKQAIGMMHKKYEEAKSRLDLDLSNLRERLYEIKLNAQVLGTMNIRYFPQADMEWLDFVLMCRGTRKKSHNYDMVIGPTADDDINMSFKTYYNGMVSGPNSEALKQELITNLKTEILGVQYCIAKQEVADAVIESITEIDWRN